VSSFHIPAEMNRTIQSLLQHYKIPAIDRFNGSPVFSREPLAGKLEDAGKRVFLGGVLETYEKLIGRMLSQLTTPGPQTVRRDQSLTVSPATSSKAGGGVRNQLSYILSLVKALRKHRYQEQDKVLQGLKQLSHVQMDNLIIQSKALWELPWLYQEASTLAESNRKQRRRRRLAQRVKTRQSMRV
ncbi:hypothetical protein LDENG_00257940, partial [Lucifuga dentata]